MGSASASANGFVSMLIIRRTWQLKASSFQSFVKNAKAVLIPKQDLDPIAITIQEQEQVAGARGLVEDLLRSAHQAVEAAIHIRWCRAQEDPYVGKVRHDFGAFQGRNAPRLG